MPSSTSSINTKPKKTSNFSAALGKKYNTSHCPDKHRKLIVLGFNDTSPLWVILCRLPEKGREEIEEIVEMKERDREEGRAGMKVKKWKK